MAADGTCAIDVGRLGPAISDLITSLELHSAASAVHPECVRGWPLHDAGMQFAWVGFVLGTAESRCFDSDAKRFLGQN